MTQVDGTASAADQERKWQCFSSQCAWPYCSQESFGDSCGGARGVDAGAERMTYSAATPERVARTRDHLLAGRWSSEVVEGGGLTSLLFDDSPIPAEAFDEHGRFVSANEAMLRLLGYARAEYLGRQIYEVAHGEDGSEEAALLAEVRSGARDRYEIRKRLKRSDDTYVSGRAVVGAARDRSGDLVGIIAQFIDPSTVSHLEDEMRHARRFHPLTGLPHWEVVVDHVERALGTARKLGHHVGIANVDIDRFVLVNDEFGNETGNALIVAIGHRMEDRVGSGDMLGHLSGDEFVVVRSDLPGPSALESFGREVVETFDEPFVVDGSEIRLSASIGLAAGRDSASGERLIRDAQLAREQARQEGGGRCVAFTHSLRSRALINENSRLALVHAHEANQLTVHYQPLIALDTRDCVGVEALLRWEDPAGGPWLPGEFVRAAEETELIIPIGAMVLRTACAQVAEWARTPGHVLGVSVNVSPVQLGDRRFPDVVRTAIAESGLQPERLTLELTESVLMEEDSDVRRTLEALRQLGARVSIDDFGTGYSSLGRIRRLPVDELKIDREFVSELDTDVSARRIVVAIVELGKALSLNVVAEGVETEATADLLQQLGCSFAQGYLFGRPSAPEACISALASRQSLRLLGGPVGNLLSSGRFFRR